MLSSDEASRAAGPGLALKKVSRDTTTADYDNDGDVDLLVTNLDGTPDLLRNNTPGGNWLRVVLQDTEGNRGGVGARVHLMARPWRFDRATRQVTGPAAE